MIPTGNWSLNYDDQVTVFDPTTPYWFTARPDSFGDPITQYDFWYTGSGGSQLFLQDSSGNTLALGANQENDLSAALLTGQFRSNLEYRAGSGGTDMLWARAFDGFEWGPWSSGFTVTSSVDPGPVMTASNKTATSRQNFGPFSLFSYSQAINLSPAFFDFWNTGGGGGQWLLDGSPLGTNKENIVPAWQIGSVNYTSGTGMDTLWVRANDGFVWGAWSNGFTVTVPAPSLTVHSIASATRGQVINFTTLLTISDPGNVGFQKLELWDSHGTISGGQFWVAGVPQSGGHEIDVNSGIANSAHVVFDAGAAAGTDTLWAQLQLNDGSVTGWQPFTVTVPEASLSVHSVANATKGQIINLSTLVTISDPGNVGYQQLELWDSNGTAAGGRFVIGGVAQTGGHEIDITSGTVAALSQVPSGLVFDAGTASGTDMLWAQLLETDGSVTGWQPFSVTVPAPFLAVHSLNGVGPGQVIPLSTLVGISDPGSVGFQKLELWDTNGTAPGWALRDQQCVADRRPRDRCLTDRCQQDTIRRRHFGRHRHAVGAATAERQLGYLLAAVHGG
jgi:hypothetical protein